MNQQAFPFEGVLLVDKASKMTSHDVVNRVRRILGMRQIGHAGTLDPLATGLLVVLVGRATRLSQYLMASDKVYQGTLKLGETTDSYDADGTILETRPVPEIKEEDFKALFQSYVGICEQLPPMFSAKKVNGQPLYKMARKGKTVERETREVTIKRFDLISFQLPYVSFELDCSKGTYVRSLVHEIGEQVECGAFLSQLRRTQSGFLSIEHAVTLDRLAEMSSADIRNQLMPMQSVLAALHESGSMPGSI